MSRGGLSTGYTYGTVSGLRIFLPLPFLVVDAEGHAYALRLMFDPDGKLSSYTFRRADREINNHLIGYTGLSSNEAVRELNGTGPELYDREYLARLAGPATRP